MLCTLTTKVSGVVLAASFVVAGSVAAQCSPHQVQVFAVPGAATNDDFGHSVARLGDVDGDGLPDFVAGSPQLSSGGVGYVAVCSGATGAVLLTVVGTTPGAYFGYAVAGIQDLNGDTLPDFIVGIPQLGFQGTGMVQVFSGSDGALLRSFSGNAPDDRFGLSVANANDADGDGVPDILVGAPYEDPLGLANAGSARIFSGATGLSIFPFPFIGLAPSQYLGASVAGPGDLNGDGHADLLVGAPGTDQARVYSGSNGAVLFTFSAGYMGEPVAAPGDVDADGVPDLLVGAPSGGVSAYAFSGSTGNPICTIGGYLCGVSLAGAGDATGDGVPDLLLGCPGAYEVHLFSGGTGTNFLTFSGGSMSSFGYSLDGLGDINGDGRSDVLIGTPAYPAGQVMVRSWFSVAAAATTFGTGCAGSGGYVPSIGWTGGAPCLGSGSYGVSLGNALAGTAAILVVGVSSNTWLGIPLPLDLGGAGLAGCFLRVSADAFLATSTGGTGTASILVGLPNNLSLLGAAVHFQWYVVDPGPFPVPGVLSEGLQIVMG